MKRPETIEEKIAFLNGGHELDVDSPEGQAALRREFGKTAEEVISRVKAIRGKE
jgi:hypothetical protein